VFTNDCWKVASPVDYATRLTVTDQSGNPLLLVTVTPPSPVCIENRNNPPTLAASTDCFTPFSPACAKWYWVDPSARIRQPIGVGMHYLYVMPMDRLWSLDNLVISRIPEPSTIALLLGGALMLAGHWFRRFRGRG
jgi:hypothetical protein